MKQQQQRVTTESTVKGTFDNIRAILHHKQTGQTEQCLLERSGLPPRLEVVGSHRLLPQETTGRSRALKAASQQAADKYHCWKREREQWQEKKGA